MISSTSHTQTSAKSFAAVTVIQHTLVASNHASTALAMNYIMQRCTVTELCTETNAKELLVCFYAPASFSGSFGVVPVFLAAISSALSTSVPAGTLSPS